MESDKIQTVGPRKYTGPVAGIKVLVVDASSACRAIVSKMLLSLGYEAVTSSLASEALSIIGDKKNELNLVLVEAQLPDMEICDFIKKMREISNIPSFILSSYDDDIPSISRALRSGAKLCFRKPVKIPDLQDLWRFSVWNRYDTIVSEEVPVYGWHPSELIMVSKSLECRPSMNTNEASLYNADGLESQPSMNTEQSRQSANGKEHKILDKDSSVYPKKNRRTWTDDLHMKFLEAVGKAGVEARPRKIYELMDVEGLTKESVAMYLKKYRQSMKLRASAMAQHVNGYVSQTKNCQGKRPLSSEQQQKNPSDLIPVYILDTSAPYITQESVICREPPFLEHHLYPFDQQLVELTPSGHGDASEENEPGYTNSADGKVSTEGQQLDTSTLLAYDRCEQFAPALPIALLPDEKYPHIFGDGYINEIFYAKESELFTDDDLNMWLSTIPDNVNNDENNDDAA